MKRIIHRTWLWLYIAVFAAACGGGGSDAGAPNSATFPPPTSVTVDTLRFTNVDFDEVEILNSFAFIVQFGDRFDIEVEIDSDYSHLVSVTQEGVRVKIQFDPTFTGDIQAQVARGIVTLPLLNVLETKGSAFVDIAGFNQSYMQIRQSGSSHIEGSNSRIDFADVSLNGSSKLLLTNMSPLPAANVELGGSSQATLDMAIGGTLSGSAAGSSNVSYFGDNVSVLVNTFNTATVTWLGSDSD